MHPAHVDVGGVEPGRWQRPQHLTPRPRTARPVAHPWCDAPPDGPAVAPRPGPGRFNSSTSAGGHPTRSLRGTSPCSDGTAAPPSPCGRRRRQAGDHLDLMVGGELDRRRKQVNRFPCDFPNAPIRSIRTARGTPPASSKNPTIPSKVCWRSIDEGEPDRPPPRPAQHTSQTEQARGPSPTGLPSRCSPTSPPELPRPDRSRSEPTTPPLP
jgi:hypothetical protein